MRYSSDPRLSWDAIDRFLFVVFVLLLCWFLAGCGRSPVEPDVPGLDGPPVLRLGFGETVRSLDSTAKVASWIRQNARYRSDKVAADSDDSDHVRRAARVFYGSGGGECFEFACFFVECAKTAGRRAGFVYSAGSGATAHIRGFCVEPSGLVSWNDNEVVFVEASTPEEFAATFTSTPAIGFSFLDQDLNPIDSLPVEWIGVR